MKESFTNRIVVYIAGGTILLFLCLQFTLYAGIQFYQDYPINDPGRDLRLTGVNLQQTEVDKKNMVNKSKVDNYLAPHTLEFDTGVQFTRCMDDMNGLIEIDFKNSLQENEIFSKTLEVDVLVGNYLKLCLAQHNHQHLVTISVDASLANAQCDLYLSTKLAKPYVFLFQNYLQKDL